MFCGSKSIFGINLFATCDPQLLRMLLNLKPLSLKQVDSTETEPASLLRLRPVEHIVNVTTKPVFDVDFSLHRGTVSGSVKCMGRWLVL